MALALFPFVSRSLGVLALVSVVTALGLFVALSTAGGRNWLRATFAGSERHPLAWVWIVSLVATIGSLYFSDGVGLIPCLLCWYQRIAMYPLAVVLGVAFWRSDPSVWRFALPLPLIGFMISAYHVLLQYRPSVEIIPCTTGAPCSGRYMMIFGFISIPWMAGAAFLFIAALLLTIRTIQAKDVAPG
jgi:disulfide bond formation protein DsbB